MIAVVDAATVPVVDTAAAAAAVERAERGAVVPRHAGPALLVPRSAGADLVEEMKTCVHLFRFCPLDDAWLTHDRALADLHDGCLSPERFQRCWFERVVNGG